MENKLQAAWEHRLKLRAESDKLHAEGNKLWAEGNKLRAEGDKLWAEAIIREYGSIHVEWKDWIENKSSFSCVLENGDVYDYTKPQVQV